MKIRTTLRFRLLRLAGYGRHMPLIRLTATEKGGKRLEAFWKKLQRDRLEREIFNSCIVLKNLSIVHQGQPMSCDFILEQLMECSRPLSNVYADMLSLYRNGGGDDAFDILYEKVPVKAAKHFSFILSRIDKLDPAELISQMTAFEETFAAERVTRGMRRAEQRSLITTVAATATVFAILLNFTVVVVFMDAMRLLGRAF
ncbi:hypothetical protein ACPW7J_06050 [Ihubacter sp. rT4E-8]|uniref:hypothetical protein n=1 Tax=unclassified Ihubacter TaxID=2633299 RepID=UPI001379EE0C